MFQCSLALFQGMSQVNKFEVQKSQFRCSICSCGEEVVEPDCSTALLLLVWGHASQQTRT